MMDLKTESYNEVYLYVCVCVCVCVNMYICHLNGKQLMNMHLACTPCSLCQKINHAVSLVKLGDGCVFSIHRPDRIQDLS